MIIIDITTWEVPMYVKVPFRDAKDTQPVPAKDTRPVADNDTRPVADKDSQPGPWALKV